MNYKSIFNVVAVVALCAASAYAGLDRSVGVGGLLISDFGGQGLRYDYTESDMTHRGRSTFPYIGGGINTFFDAEYAEASVGYAFAGGQHNYYDSVITKNNKNSVSERDSADYSYNFLNLGLTGKYPFAIGRDALFYPAIGVDYTLWLSAKGDGVKIASDSLLMTEYSHFWVKLGLGLDFAFTNVVFFRAQAFYGIGFAGKFFSEIAEKSDTRNANLSHGFTLKVGLGFMLSKNSWLMEIHD